MFSGKQCRYIVDESSMISYTEDGIPIEKLYVGNLPPEVTQKQVTEYFEQFGNVAHVDIKKGVSRQEPYFYGFITFKEPKSATNVLRNSTQNNYTLFHGKRIQIKPADSWNQPKKDQPLKMKGQLQNENLKVKIRDMILCRKELNAKLLLDLTLMEIREILSEIGSHVECFVYEGKMSELSEDRIFQLLSQNCVNVKKLVCARRYVWCKGNCDKPFKDIKVLDMDFPSKSKPTDLQNFSNLEYLDLSNNSDVTGMCLLKLSNLKVLNLSNCRKFEPKYFKAICMQNKLGTLYIERCEYLDDESIETLASTQTKLENLSISSYYKATNLSPLATLNSLKRLRIDCRRKTCDDFFQELAERRCKELEILTIWNCCFNEKVEQAICSLKNLRMLEICGWCDVNNLFLTKLAILIQYLRRVYLT